MCENKIPWNVNTSYNGVTKICRKAMFKLICVILFGTSSVTFMLHFTKDFSVEANYL